MSVAFVGGESRIPAAGTTVIYSYTVGSGSDRLLLLQTYPTGSSGTVTGVTYGGDALTNIDTSDVCLTWSKTAPLTGSNTVSISVATYSTIFTSTSDWTGVDQTTPVGAAVVAGGSSSSPSTGSVTCPTNGAIWGAEYSAYTTGSAPTAGSGTTLAGAVRNGASGETKAAGYRTTTGAVSWSLGSSAGWVAAGIPINAVAVAPDISGTVTLDDVTISGTLAVGASGITGTVTLEDITPSGLIGGGSGGTITSLPFVNNTGTLLTSESGVTVYVYSTAGALITTKTGQTTHATTGVMTFTDAYLSPGTTYRCVTVFSSGAEAMDRVVAA